MMQSCSLQGRVALVTGASRDRGIGAAICRALAAAGADICFSHWRAYDRTMPWGEEEAAPAALERELQALGVRCAGIEADLSIAAAPALLLDAATARLGLPAILVNNATHSLSGGWQALTAADLDSHYAVNVRATLLLSVEFARRFVAAHGGSAGGRIINLTSGQSLGPLPEELAYAATKGAVEAFTVSLSDGLAGRGITVNAVDPGPTDTGWMTDAVQHSLLPHFPQGRIGRPEDAARLVAFLASDAAAWITGQVLHSEGGFRRGGG